MSFEKLINNFLKPLDLVDLSGYGVARQSSFSKWSKIDDPQRPVLLDDCDDFAFHTDFEDNPTWEFVFDKPMRVRCLLINNRKKMPFNKINKDIKVEVFNDYDVKLVYQGSCLFNSFPNGLPLILELDEAIRINKIRITLVGNNYLHLGVIKILGKYSDDSEFESNVQDGFCFYSIRKDGFGERIKSLLNTIVLAEYYNLPYKFSWEKIPGDLSNYHSISDKEKVFSDSYIKKHYICDQDVKPKKLSNLKDLKLASNDLNVFKKEVTNRSLNGVVVTQNSLKFQFPFDTSKFISHGEAFSLIDFSSEMESVKNSANTMVVGTDTVAVHLRAGDIIFDFYRFMSRYLGKIIPYHASDLLIEKLSKKHQKVIIFGQDEKLCRYFANKYSASFAPDFYDDGYTVEQKSMFDISVMANCKSIYAGSSGFAVLASWISGKAIIDYNKEVSSEEAKDLIFSEIELETSEFSVLHKTFSVFSFFYMNKDSLEFNDALRLIDYCIKNDSHNFYYKLNKVIFLFESSFYDHADEYLREVVIDNQESRYGLAWMAKTVHPDNTTTLQELTKKLKFPENRLISILKLYDDRFFKKENSHALLHKVDNLIADDEQLKIVRKDFI